MKNHSASFDKYNNSSNRSKLKSFLSVLTIGLFIFSGFASLDEGDPEYKEVDCKFLQPAAIVNHILKLNTYDENNNPIGDGSISFNFYDYEKTNDNGLCAMVLKAQYGTILFLNSSGAGSYKLSKKYVSEDDVIEIYFEASHPGYNSVRRNLVVNKSDLSVDIKINLTKNEQYP